jgi:hypothetical protein
MAEVQRPIVPSRLYRYRSLTRSADAVQQEINSILKKYLYCSEFTRMNDPMEGFYRPSKILRGKSDYKGIVRQITDSKSGVGIACFTETYEDVLMWTHYAGNYTGMCLSYSTKELLVGLPVKEFRSACMAIRRAFGMRWALPPDRKATRTCASTRVSPPRVTRWRRVIEAPVDSLEKPFRCAYSCKGGPPIHVADSAGIKIASFEHIQKWPVTLLNHLPCRKIFDSHMGCEIHVTHLRVNVFQIREVV